MPDNDFDWANYIGCLPIILIGCLVLPIFFPDWTDTLLDWATPFAYILGVILLISALTAIFAAARSNKEQDQDVLNHYKSVQARHKKIKARVSQLSWGQKVGCALGYHSFGEWEYLEKDSCRRYRICEKCAKLEHGGQHDWGDWHYLRADSCDQQRDCKRCGDVEKRTAKHQYEGWAYIRQGSCVAHNTCARCGAYYEKVEHQWPNEWQFAGPNVCEQIQRCARCGKTQTQSVEHAWGRWDYASPTSCQQVRFCQRCYKMDTGDVVHSFPPDWHYYSAEQDRRVCSHCGKQEFKPRARD